MRVKGKSKLTASNEKLNTNKTNADGILTLRLNPMSENYNRCEVIELMEWRI